MKHYGHSEHNARNIASLDERATVQAHRSGNFARSRLQGEPFEPFARPGVHPAALRWAIALIALQLPLAWLVARTLWGGW